MDRDPNPEVPNSHRKEVYERIPWEHLERQATDRQWLYVGVAGAIAIGALAYSFVKNQPLEPAAMTGPLPTTGVEVSESPSESTPSASPSVSSPVVVTEADLYAADPQRLEAAASAHAEWFAVEYFSVDGSEVSKETLRRLLPDGVPLPEAPEGTQVFVDWAGVRQVTRVGEADFEVDVLVRSLLSTETGGFARQPGRMLRVRIHVGPDGAPSVAAPPLMVELPLVSPVQLDLSEVPPDMASTTPPGAVIVGGMQWPDGSWRMIVMTTGIDGVKRPEVVEVP